RRSRPSCFGRWPRRPAGGRWRRTCSSWRTTLDWPPRSRSRSAQPGLNDDLGEAPAVAEGGGLLRLSARPRDDRHRNLDHARAMPERLDQDLARPELVLLEDEALEELRAGGPEAAGGVGDPPAGEDRHDPSEQMH